MKKRTARLVKWIFLVTSVIAALAFFSIFSTSFILTKSKVQPEITYNDSDTCLYHVIVTGTYENQSFLKELYDGANLLAKSYNALVELHIPDSQADQASLQELLNYASFLNVDGIIAYIDSPDQLPELLHRNGEAEIPLITTGQFSPNLNQVSFIGINNWELGKRLANESRHFLPRGGNLYIVSGKANTTSSNLITSLQQELQNTEIICTIIEEIPFDFDFPANKSVFITLNEDDTIQYAQVLAEQYTDKKCKLIGLGGNEVCQMYLQKGLIEELFSLNPEKIGEKAMRELFEYRNHGYANSYITADVKVNRSPQ